MIRPLISDRRPPLLGFTLIELLVVIAIIGLLVTLAVFAVANARQQARDAKRVGDIKQIQNALDLYVTTAGGYPEFFSLELGGSSAGHGECLGNNGFGVAALDEGGVVITSATDVCNGMSTIYMRDVPGNPAPGGTPYVYSGTSCTSGGSACEDYTITFSLEGESAGLSGNCTATSAGRTCTP